MKALLLLVATLVLTACDNAPDAQAQNQQVATGKQVFQDNCQSCHGVNARGAVKDWQKKGVDGKFPAPPLDGSAHAWHHNMKALMGTVNRGGIPLGGTMPAFKDTLTEDQKIAVLVYVQSLWPEEIYAAWKKNNG
jgi:mono/diheme cytochrome c family protein